MVAKIVLGAPSLISVSQLCPEIVLFRFDPLLADISVRGQKSGSCKYALFWELIKVLHSKSEVDYAHFLILDIQEVCFIRDEPLGYH